MEEENKKVLREFIAENWQQFVNHCDRHGLNEEQADGIYEQLDEPSR